MEKQETIKKIQETMPKVEDTTFNKFQSELSKIRKRGRVESDKIIVKEITDHKNISLWTKDGKRIGPMHPHNAEKAFNTFWNMGIQLSADQPTQEEIEAYKKTGEYKAKETEFKSVRERKDKSRRAGQMEKYAKMIAEMTGTNLSLINSIVKNAKDIRPLAEGPGREEKQHIDPTM